MKIKLHHLITCLAAFGFAGSLQAAVIAPNNLTASAAGLSSRPVGTIIDGSGLLGTGDILTQTHYRSDEGGNDHYYITGGASTVTFDFVLDTTTDVDGIHLWQYVNKSNGTTGYRQIDTATLTFSTDGGTSFGNSTDLNFSAISNTVGEGNVPVQTLTFTEISGVTNIKMVANAFSASDRLAVAEVRFDGAAVPEPSAALFGGFALLALMLRRRR